MSWVKEKTKNERFIFFWREAISNNAISNVICFSRGTSLITNSLQLDVFQKVPSRSNWSSLFLFFALSEAEIQGPGSNGSSFNSRPSIVHSKYLFFPSFSITTPSFTTFLIITPKEKFSINLVRNLSQCSVITSGFNDNTSLACWFFWCFW